VSQNWYNISKIHNFIKKVNFEANEREKLKVFLDKMSIDGHFDYSPMAYRAKSKSPYVDIFFL
jgi:hypothetical protein